MENERSKINIAQLDLKQESGEKNINDWHIQCDEITAEIELIENETRQNISEISIFESARTLLLEQITDLKRDNKTIANETRGTYEQLASLKRIHNEITKKVL